MHIYEIELFGIIQGVGFRPFVYTLAQGMGLKGYVQNRYTSLFILLECSPAQQEAFLSSLLSAPPPNALIERYELREWESLHAWRQAQIDTFQNLDSESLAPNGFKSFEDFKNFEILPSSPAHLAGGTLKSSSPHISPPSLSSPSFLPKDLRICPDCLSEMRQRGRFEGYAFTTCTNCGARYSILKALPYDRIHTSMSEFPMCSACQSEYDNPQNRRFHAQPHSCLECAVRLRLIDESGEVVSPKRAADDIGLIRRVAEAIENGTIVAIEGVGGFNLVASASNANAIATLRRRKNRPHKPFALMFPSIEEIEKYAYVSELEAEALHSAAAPIVLLKRRFDTGYFQAERGAKASESHPDSEKSKMASLSLECLQLIAPNVATIGAILPYNGIMCLLFDLLRTPLVFTSANLSGEPIISDIESLREKLGGVYDMALFYNRRIVHAIDDSIMRLMGGSMRVLRLARGLAPHQFSLHLPLQGGRNLKTRNKSAQNKSAQSPLLALGVGAQQKLTLSFLHLDSDISESSADLEAQGGQSTRAQVLISSYIGDFGGVETAARYEGDFAFFSSLYVRGGYVRGGEHGGDREYQSNAHQALQSLLIGRDLHPGYHSSEFATTLATHLTRSKTHALSHHKAHFYALLAESGGLAEPGLGLIWDGTGLGEDGAIWGGECFCYKPRYRLGSEASGALDSEMSESEARMARVAHFEEFALLGGESAIKDIYKSALSLLWQHGLEAEARALWEENVSTQGAYDILHALYKRGQGAMRTSSVGRLFDAVAYILGLLEVQSYEGQSGAYIEAAALEAIRAARAARVANSTAKAAVKVVANPIASDLEAVLEVGQETASTRLDSENPPFAPFGFEIAQNGVIRLGGLMRELLASKHTQGAQIAAYRFIETLAHIVMGLYHRYGGQKRLYLSGGVFQNKLLCDRIHALAKAQGIEVVMHQIVPCNDSGISFGQAVYAILKEQERG